MLVSPLPFAMPTKKQRGKRTAAKDSASVSEIVFAPQLKGVRLIRFVIEARLWRNWWCELMAAVSAEHSGASSSPGSRASDR